MLDPWHIGSVEAFLHTGGSSHGQREQSVAEASARRSPAAAHEAFEPRGDLLSRGGLHAGGRRWHRRLHADDHPRRGRQPADGRPPEAGARLPEGSSRHPGQDRDPAREPAPAAGHRGCRHQERPLRPVHHRHLRSSDLGQERLDRESRSLHPEVLVLRARRPDPRGCQGAHLQLEPLRRALLRRVIDAHVSKGPPPGGGSHALPEADLG